MNQICENNIVRAVAGRTNDEPHQHFRLPVILTGASQCPALVGSCYGTGQSNLISATSRGRGYFPSNRKTGPVGNTPTPHRRITKRLVVIHGRTGKQAALKTHPGSLCITGGRHVRRSVIRAVSDWNRCTKGTLKAYRGSLIPSLCISAPFTGSTAPVHRLPESLNP